MPQNWSSESGTVFGNPELSSEQRMVAARRMKLLDAVTPAGDLALDKKSGDRVSFRVRGELPTLRTTPIAENQKVPFDKAPKYYVTTQVYRRAQAMNSTHTYKTLDRLDGDSVDIKSLTLNSARVHNKLIYDELTSGRSLCYQPQSASTYTVTNTGTINGAAAAVFSRFHAQKINLTLTQYNVPTADGSNYFGFCSPLIADNLLLDVGVNGYVDIAKYSPSEVEGLLMGEVGKIAGIRLSVDNDAMNDLGQTYGEMFVLGDNAIREVLVYPSHFRFEDDLGDDFGNQSGVAWQSMLAYKTEANYTAFSGEIGFPYTLHYHR